MVVIIRMGDDTFSLLVFPLKDGGRTKQEDEEKTEPYSIDELKEE